MRRLIPSWRADSAPPPAPAVADAGGGAVHVRLTPSLVGKYARGLPVSVASLQALLVWHGATGPDTHVDALVDARGTRRQPDMPSGVFSNLPAGDYDAVLTAGASAANAAPLALQREMAGPAVGDVGRAAALVVAARASATHPSPTTTELLDRLAASARAGHHDLSAAVMTRREAPMQYAVAVSAHAVLVALQGPFTSEAAVGALVDPGAPLVSLPTSADGATVNAGAATLAALLPFHTLVALCDGTDHPPEPSAAGVEGTAAPPPAPEDALLRNPLQETMARLGLTPRPSTATGMPSPTASVAAAAAATVTPPRRQLIFCGESAAGTVAHTAALLARLLVPAGTVVQAITFSAPCMASRAVALQLVASGLHVHHLTVYDRADLIPALAAAAADGAGPSDDATMGMIRRLLCGAPPTESTAADEATLAAAIAATTIATTTTTATTTTDVAAPPHDTQLTPLGLVAVVAGTELAHVAPGRIRDLLWAPSLAAAAAGAGTDLATVLVAHRRPAAVLALLGDPLSHSTASATRTVTRLNLLPTIAKCTVTVVGDGSSGGAAGGGRADPRASQRTIFTITGAHLEAALGRDLTLAAVALGTTAVSPSSTGGAAAGMASATAAGAVAGAPTASAASTAVTLGGRSVPPLALLSGFEYDADAPMLVVSATPHAVRVDTSQCTYVGQGQLAVRTDFGDSPLFTVTALRRNNDSLARTFLYTNINTELLETAFLRGLLSMVFHLEDDAAAAAAAAEAAADTEDGYLLDHNRVPHASTGVGRGALPPASAASPSATTATRRPGLGFFQRSTGTAAAARTAAATGGAIPDSELHPLLHLIAELEQMLLQKSTTAAVVRANLATDRLHTARTEMQPVFRGLVDFVMTPVRMDNHSVAVRGMLRVLGGVGVVVGGVIAVVGAIAFLPALVPAIAAGAVLASGRGAESPGRRVAAATLLVPTAILALPGGLFVSVGSAILGRSVRAVRDSRSQQYLETLKVLLLLLSGDPERELEEIPVLEAAIARRLARILPSYMAPEDASLDAVRKALDDHILQRHLQLPRKTTTTAEPSAPDTHIGGIPINHLGATSTGDRDRRQRRRHGEHHQDDVQQHDDDDDNENDDDNDEDADTDADAETKAAAGQLYARLIPESRAMLVRWLAAVARLARLRRLVQQELVVSFVGARNAHAATLIHRLFGVGPTGASAAADAGSNSFVRLYRLHQAPFTPPVASHAAASATASKTGDLVVDVAEFEEGATTATANLTQRLSDITTVFVCLFCVDQVGEAERRTVELVRAKGKDVLILVRWKGPLNTADAQARVPDEQERVARALDVPPECIAFTTATEDGGEDDHDAALMATENVRKLIFGMLLLYAGLENAPKLALMLSHPVVRDALAADPELAADWNLTGRAVADLLDNSPTAHITPDVVRARRTHLALSAASYFMPVLSSASKAAAAAREAAAAAAAAAARTPASSSLRPRPSLSRRGTSAAELDASLALETRLVDLLSSLGYEPAIVQCSLRILRRALAILAARNQTNGNGDGGRRQTPHEVVDALEQLERTLQHLRSGAQAAADVGPNGPAFVMFVLGMVTHVTQLTRDFRAMGFSEAAVLSAIDAMDVVDYRTLTVDVLLEPVMRCQDALNDDAAAAAAAAAAASATATDTVPSRPTPATAPSNDAEHAASARPAPAVVVAPAAGTAEMTAAPPLVDGSPVPAEASAFDQDAGGLSLTPVVLQGLQNMHLVTSRTRFTVCERISPTKVYPDFRTTMSLGDRSAMFTAALRAQGISSGDWLSATPIQLTAGEAKTVYTSLVEAVLERSIEQLRAGVKITLSNDEAVDAKGVLRSVMNAVADHLRAGGCKYLTPVANGELYLSPRCVADRTGAARELLALGRILGICLQNIDNDVRLPACLALPLFKLLLGEPVGLPDLELMDPVVGDSVKQMCQMDATSFDSLGLTYAVDVGPDETYDLCPDGANKDVTAGTRIGYLADRVWFHLGRGAPIKSLVLGVGHSCRRDLLSIFSPAMLQLLLNGRSDFSVDDLRAATTVSEQFAGPRAILVEWFWQSVARMTPEERRLLLAFVTGSSTIPAAGIGSLRFTLVPHLRGTHETLPVSHTCFYMLELPPYLSADELHQRLLFAINNVSSGQFGQA